MAGKQESKTDKLEREYIINLRRKVEGVPVYKRAPKAIRTIKEFLARHMKIRDRDLGKIKLDRYLNEFLWARGIKNPQTRIKVKAVKEGEIVRAELSELPNELKFKKLREEKREKEGAEAGKKKKEEKKEKPEETRPGEGELEEKKVEEKAKEAKPEEEKKVEEEKKEEEKEKKASVVEAGKEMEKKIAKIEKHKTKISKQPKRQFRQALQK